MSIIPLLAELAAIFIILLAVPYLLYFQYIQGKSKLGVQPSACIKERISVLICTLNAADTIEQKIVEVQNQKYPVENIELIVVDGASTDGTVEILRSLEKKVGEKVTLKVYSSARFAGKASQVNEGFNLSSSPYVITTDADCTIESNAIPILMGALTQKGVGAVCSRQILTNPGQNLITGTEATYRGFYQTLRMGESNLHSTPIYHGGLSGYRKEAFSTIFEDVNADDTQLALGAVRKGFRALYEPRCVYYTNSPARFIDGLRQRIRRGQGLQRIFWRNRDIMFSHRYGTFGFPIFAAEFFMHLISPILFVMTSALVIAILSYISVPVFSIALPAYLIVLLFAYWKKRSRPVAFVISFAYYQIALFCAMILHGIGYNYRRWSRVGNEKRRLKIQDDPD